MADGTYGSPFYQNSMSPIEPNTPTTKFATNVNRKKTRKWVEAKKINYDGSGWGDEDEDEEEEELPTTAPVATPVQLPSQQSSPAPRNLPSLAPTPGSSAGPAATPGRPPLHLQTQQQQQQRPWGQGSPVPGAPDSNAQFGPRASPQLRTSSPGVVAPSPRSGSLPPGANRTPWTEGRSSSPLGARGQSPAAAGRRGHFIRPSEIYKRAANEETQPKGGETEQTTRGRAEQTAPPTASVGAIEAATPTKATGLASAVAASDPVQPEPARDSVTSSVQPTNTAGSPEQPQHKPQPSVESTSSDATRESDGIDGERRFSTSPKLPDFGRFSTFAPDLLFSGGSSFLSDAPPMPTLPTSPAAASHPAQETSTDDATGVLSKPPVAEPTTASLPQADKSEKEPAELAPHQRKGSFSSASDSASALRDSAATATTATTAASAEAAKHQSAGDGSLSLDTGVDMQTKEAPTIEKDEKPSPQTEQAPSESNKSLDEPAVQSQTYPTSPAAESPQQVAATAPLNPHRANPIGLQDDVAIQLPHREMERTETTSTVASSPVKESDMLREEIIRTLSPVKMTEPPRTDEAAAFGQSPSAGVATAATQPKSDHARTLTRDSSYLQNVYDDYWTADDTSGPESRPDNSALSDPPPPVPPLTSAAAPAAAGPTAAATAAATDAPNSAAAAFVPAVTVAAASLPSAAFAPVPEPQYQPTPVASPSLGSGNAPRTFSNSPAIRRRFSWEMDPEEETQLGPAPTNAAPATLPAAVVVSPVTSTSPVGPPVNFQSAAAAAPTDHDRQSPRIDTNASVSALSASTAMHEPMSPSPVSEAVVPAEATSPKDVPVVPDVQQATQRPLTQPPVRSMLDVGDEAPAHPAQRASAPESLQPVTSIQTTQPVQPVQSAQPAQPVSPVQPPEATQASQPVQSAEPVHQEYNPAAYTAPDGAAKFLTLRECMAFETHPHRMARLAETRREYAAADSGLGSWLLAMTAIPEYSRAAYAPLWDTNGTAPPPSSRPVVAHVAHVAHVSIPSSSQISHKSKEILAATGKAGKGLLALRKKGFHKKTAN